MIGLALSVHHLNGALYYLVQNVMGTNIPIVSDTLEPVSEILKEDFSNIANDAKECLILLFLLPVKLVLFSVLQPTLPFTHLYYPILNPLT